MLLVRVVPLALVLGCGLRGAEEPLPPIFAPRQPAPAPPPLIAHPRLNSDGVSHALRERIREKAAALEIARPLARDKPGETPVMLEKIVVLGEKETGEATTARITPLERFLKTGRYFETERAQGDVKFSPTKAGDLRIEVGVSLKW